MRIQQELNAGRMPTSQFIHGLLVFGGGLLLLTPGFLTDAFGISMVFPLSRFFWTRTMGYWFEKMVQSGNVQFHFFGQQGGQRYEYHGGSHHKKEEPQQVDRDTFETHDYEVHDKKGQQE